MSKCDLCDKIKAKYKVTRAQITEQESVEGLIDADLVRSIKAMFYEEVGALLRIERSKNKKQKGNTMTNTKKKKLPSKHISKEDTTIEPARATRRSSQ